ncbi:PhzF family phenazine biosynthesis protein [Antrihabitans stalactiti]|uniref:PhzF family phenazine biosynthesis protein n=1 Tax=Antrihabitans stalactiti TaxID=2584121 RepID=A0A848K6T4_9NOCA|nr:PhzF family phenazine biosynthesis protein [Antrihabitans stalactiti]NMN94099.1 PhzF family phenazine biosynthesis protein [Antrihabitans stalactiti]
MGVEVNVVRVFTDPTGEFGNILGIIDAAAVPEDQRLSVAKHLGYSETVFVELAALGSTVRAQIFTPATELAFAGHPTVGLGWWLSERGTPVESLEVPAGLVAVTRTNGLTKVRARAEWAAEATFLDLPTADDVVALDPDSFTDGHHYAWAWSDESAGAIRSRMFAPNLGIREDEATGADAVRITSRLQRDLVITQGRGSQIFTTYNGDGWVTIGGRTVPERTFTL